MARKVKTKRSEPIDSAIDTSKARDFRSPLLSKKTIIIAGLIILTLLAWRYKSLLIAATVNGQPVSRMELNNQLTKRFGAQVLDNIINERLILSATREQGIFVTSVELDERISSIEKKIKGQTSLADALAVQGLTPEMFRRQLEIQIAIEKLFTNEASVSSKEIGDYIASNTAYYKDATDPATLREEVKTTLTQQKINEKFEPWFSEIRKSASVVKFIN